MWFSNSASHSVECLFTFLIVSFDVQSFYFWRSPIYLFFFCCRYFGGHICKTFAKSKIMRSWLSVLRIFSFSLLNLSLWPIISLYIWYKERVQLHSFARCLTLRMKLTLHSCDKHHLVMVYYFQNILLDMMC